MRIVWEGPLFRPLSLDKINRNLIIQALGQGNEILAIPTDGVPDVPFDTFDSRINSVISGYEPADCHVRHMWPPYWSSRCGPLILNQPWEYGPIPEDWVDPIQTSVHTLVVPSLAVREMYLAADVSDTKIRVIPNGIDPSIYHPFGPAIGITERPRTVFLWIGGLIHRKGLDVLLKAYRHAFTRRDDVMLIVKTVGQHSVYPAELPDDVKKMLADPKAPRLDVITQDLNETQMAALYRCATCLVSPYRGEGFNLPVLEAMASGVLVAASDTNPTNEFVPEDIGFRISGKRQEAMHSHSRIPGWYFEPDIFDLANLLQQIATLKDGDISRRAEMGRRWALHEYSWQKIWQQWESLVTKIPIANNWSTGIRADHTIIWQGPIRNASGYAADARLFLKTLPQCGIIPRIIDQIGATHGAITPAEERFFSALEQVPVTRNCLTLQSLPVHAANIRRTGFNLIRTTFEADRIPSSWVARLANFHAILVFSHFDVRTFSNSGVPLDKLIRVPSPVNTDFYRPGEIDKTYERLRFISVFDWIDRKGWDVLITAWAQAFKATDPVTLFIKTTTIANMSVNPMASIVHLLSKLNRSLSDTAPIQIINGNWNEEQLRTFYQVADVFVLPTRGEGWGRPVLEAMACGLPAMVTNWSGPSDYISPNNALPIAVKSIVEVPNNTDMMILHGHRWAEPDGDHLVELLRWAADHKEALQIIGLQARETALQYHPVKVAQQLNQVFVKFGVVALNHSHLSTP